MLLKRFTAGIVALAGLFSLGAVATPAEAASGICSSGYVCLYTTGGWENTYGTYYRTFYNYGYYNLSGEYGWRVIVNAQTGNAKVWLCKGYNGTNCVAGPAANTPRAYFDITPINSILLTP